MTVDDIYLEGSLLNRRDEAMERLGRALCLPEWWGRNLDALHDCLTEPGEPTALVLAHRAEMEGTIFGRRLLRVLEDAAAENPFLQLEEDGTDSG